MGNDLIDGDSVQFHAYPETVMLRNADLTDEARRSLDGDPSL